MVFHAATLKDGLSLKKNLKKVYEYSMVTKYLCNNARVEYIDN